MRNVIESGSGVEKVDVTNMDKWVLTLTGVEMVQMVTHLTHLSVHTLSSKTDSRVSHHPGLDLDLWKDFIILVGGGVFIDYTQSS